MTSRIFTSRFHQPVWIALILCLIPIVACGGASETETPADANPASADEAQAETPQSDEGEGFEPVTSRSAEATGSDAGDDGAQIPTDGAVADGTEIQAPGVAFRLPATWRNEAPSSNMRLAQASIPGDGGDGQLTVFYFGPGGGGGVEPNIDRWIGQIQADPGTQPRRIRMDLEGGLIAHWVEVEGTLQPSMMGTGPTEAQPGSRLQGAVVEGPQGPWFFKATGPSSTLDSQRDAFFSMLRSIQPNG